MKNNTFKEFLGFKNDIENFKKVFKGFKDIKTTKNHSKLLKRLKNEKESQRI